MNFHLPIAVSALTLALAGCAQAPVRYNPAPVPPPTTRTIPPPPTATAEVITSANSKTVMKSRDKLWRSVSSALSQSPFAVTSVDYKTGVMQLRYAGDPRNYIDCGRVNSKITLPTGERNYEFPAAIAYQQYQINNQGRVFNVDRRMNLEAQIVLMLQSLDATRTSARVETRYGVNRDQYVTPLDGGAPFNASDSVSFMYNESATFPNAATRCTATMQLENELMQFIK
ncbi:MAG: hypothetical protein WCD07_07275 [Burkholderiales bacterium]